MEAFRARSGSEPSRYFPHFPHGANFRDCGASAPVSPSPYQNDAFRGVQHVQVWRDDGTLGVVTVPSPVQCRNTVCNDASTQTEETITQNPVTNCAHPETQYEANCAFSNARYDNNCEHSRPQYDNIRTQYDNSCAHSCNQFDKVCRDISLSVFTKIILFRILKFPFRKLLKTISRHRWNLHLLLPIVRITCCPRWSTTIGF